MDGYIGQVILFAGIFAPQNWAFCQGQVLSIDSNTALFSLLGTTYGGNGKTTFALPDLRSRVPIGAGQGPGLSEYTVGQRLGVESTGIKGSVEVSLKAENLPSHTHGIAGGVNVAVADQVGNFPSAAKGNPLAKTAMEVGTSADVEMYVGGRTTPSYSEGNKLGGVSHNLTTTATGTGTPFNAPFVGNVPIVQPYTALNYIICMYGMYPSKT